MNIILLISSQRTSRIYLNILKNYLQKEFPDAHLSYFISQHDSENTTKRTSSIIESKYMTNKENILLSLDGFIPNEMLSNITAKKALLYLSEEGMPKDKHNYLKGYDYFLASEKEVVKYFEDECAKRNITLIPMTESAFDNEICDEGNVKKAQDELYKKYPQIEGKKIFSFITRGTCLHHYLEKYKTVDIKSILQQLPENVIFMTNCRQIQLSASRLPYKYTDKYIAFGQNDLKNVICASDWIISNMAITEHGRSAQVPLLYNGNQYEKQVSVRRKAECIKPNDTFVEDVLSVIKLQKQSQTGEEARNKKTLSDVLRYLDTRSV